MSMTRPDLIARLTRALEAVADGEPDLCGDIIADVLTELESAEKNA